MTAYRKFRKWNIGFRNRAQIYEPLVLVNTVISWIRLADLNPCTTYISLTIRSGIAFYFHLLSTVQITVRPTKNMYQMFARRASKKIYWILTNICISTYIHICYMLFNQQQCFIYSTASFLLKLRAKKVEKLRNSSFIFTYFPQFRSL
jgi:hypothetical protein